LEWRNIKTIISQAADKSMGKYKAFTQNKKLKILADTIKLSVQQKKLAYKKYLQTKKINKETEYKSTRANAKREIKKRHHKSWEQFTSHLEHDIYKIKPNTFKLLNHMNKDIKESAHGRIG
jgi:DNA repair photolyase